MLRDAYIGEDKISRIYTGEHLVHPSPVMDGLVLWYDFMGRRNNDAKRGIAEDLSENENDGTLMNFAYQAGSGYEGDGLRFDGVDDYVLTPRGSLPNRPKEYSYGVTFKPISIPTSGAYQMILTNASPTYTAIRLNTNPQTLFLSFQITRDDGSIFQQTMDTGLAILAGTTYSISIVFLGDLVQVYNNGTLIYSRGSEGVVSIDLYNIGRYVNDSLPLLNGEVYSTHFYNRALTPSEIAHNYAIEKERWNL